jgi:hypothetical protein
MQQSFSEDYINDYLTHVGLPINEKNKRLAEWALNAPVPAGWKEEVSQEGDVYYWRYGKDNERVVSWEHPIDDILKEWANDKFGYDTSHNI